MWLLERSFEQGVELLEATLADVRLSGGRVVGVDVVHPSGARETVACGAIVDAAGPMAADVARLAGVDLPLTNELHGKVYLDDALRVAAVERKGIEMFGHDGLLGAGKCTPRAELATFAPGQASVY